MYVLFKTWTDGDSWTRYGFVGVFSTIEKAAEVAKGQPMRVGLRARDEDTEKSDIFVLEQQFLDMPAPSAEVEREMNLPPGPDLGLRMTPVVVDDLHMLLRCSMGFAFDTGKSRRTEDVIELLSDYWPALWEEDRSDLLGRIREEIALSKKGSLLYCKEQWEAFLEEHVE